MEVGLTGTFGLTVVKHVEMGQRFDHECAITPPHKIMGQIVWGQQ